MIRLSTILYRLAIQDRQVITIHDRASSIQVQMNLMDQAATTKNAEKMSD